MATELQNQPTPENKTVDSGNPIIPGKEVINQQLAGANNGAITAGDPTKMVETTSTIGQESAANPEGKIMLPEASVQKTTEQVTDTSSQLNKAITDLSQTQEGLAAEASKRAEEDKATAQKDIKEEQKYAAQQAQTIRNADEGLAQVEQDRLKLAETIKNEEAQRLQSEFEATKARQEEEVALVKQEKELQRVKDDNAIKKAEQDIDIAHQQANWAFNKLGLTFSSGSILQTQQIATNGATRIAELKVQASYNQAKISVDIARLMEDINKTQLGYSKQINDNINNFQDKSITIQEQATQRIKDITQSLLLNNKEKQDKIDQIKTQLKTDLRANEDGLKTEQERITDKLIEYTDKKQQDLIQSQNIGKQKINDSITNGSIYSMTSTQKAQLAASAGLTIDELNAVQDNSLSSLLSQVASTTMGDPGFLFSASEKIQVTNLAKEYLKAGKDITTATQLATTTVLENNPGYKNKILDKQKERKIADLKIQEAEKSIAQIGRSSGGSGSSTTNGMTAKELAAYKKDFRREVLADGTIVYVNPFTNETLTPTQLGETTGVVGETQPNFLQPFGGTIQGPVITQTPIKVNTKVYGQSDNSDPDADL